MPDRPAILIMQRHLAPLTAFLEGAYTVYRFWEGPPVEAQADIRALVVAGEFPLDKALIERLPNLSLIACFTSGYDGIDVDWEWPVTGGETANARPEDKENFDRLVAETGVEVEVVTPNLNWITNPEFVDDLETNDFVSF